MACSSPFFLERIKDYRGRPVPLPCQKCNCCRADKTTYWTRRAGYEWTHSISSAFVTFTYDEEHLPIGGSLEPTLRRDDLHRYIDTVRHRLKKDGKIPPRCVPNFSYMASGEYGDSFGRPHYHVLFFGLDFETCKKYLKKSWPYGSIAVNPVRDGAIRYVVSYISKQLYGEERDAQFFDYGVEAPFLSVSRGFGSGLFKDQAENIREYGALKFGQKFFSVPSYWKNKFIDMDIEKADERYERSQRLRFERWNLSGRHFQSPAGWTRERNRVRELVLYQKARNRNSKIGYERPIEMHPTGIGSAIVRRLC
ncbi:replication initiation protein [Tortoise microvirus 107]|nr:replication initiation protein [Tortoise microvirus 107]